MGYVYSVFSINYWGLGGDWDVSMELCNLMIPTNLSLSVWV